MTTLLLVMAAGMLASVMNAAAGGGTFVTFPALVLFLLRLAAFHLRSAAVVSPGHDDPFAEMAAAFSASTGPRSTGDSGGVRV